MFDDKQPEVLVAGAGPVGMFAALALANQRIAVQIVDAGWQPGMHSYALALHSRSLGLLREVGLYESAMADAYPVSTIGLYDEKNRRAEVRIGDGAAGYPCLAVLRQDVLEEVLEAALQDNGVGVLWSHRLARASSGPDFVNATVEALEKESRGYAVAHTEWVVAESAEIQPKYLIGADGHGSWVRRTLRIGFPEVGRAQYFAVFEFDSSADLRNEMRIAFSNGTTNVVWPLPEGRVRWSFELPSYSARESHREKDRFAVQVEAGEYPTLAEDSLRLFLAERAPWFTGSVDAIAWRIVVRFEKRLADSFGRDRIWLAGDSAHLTGPAGIQSMNSGLQEAFELARIVERGLRGEQVAEDFADHGRRRLAMWRELLGLEGGLRPTSETDPWIAQHAGALLSCLPALGPDLNGMAAQLGLEFGAPRVAGA